MINHVRTLLLARRAVETAGTYADTYIEPGFRPHPLPPALESARAIVVSNADWAVDASRFRAAMLLGSWLQCVHLAELDPLARAMDSRITYDLGMESLSGISAPRTSINVFDSSGTLAATAKLGAGPLRTAAYQLTGIDDRVTIRSGSAIMRTERVVFTNGISQPLVLQPDALSVVLTADENEFPTSAVVKVVALAPPGRDMATRWSSVLAHPLVAGLSLFNPDTEELEALRTIWLDSATLPVRLGAFAIAVAMRIERVRTGTA